jgi:hypothetical protein
MTVTTGLALGYPEDAGMVVVDDRGSLAFASQGTAIYRQFFGSANSNSQPYIQLRGAGVWLPWQKVITSEAGVISDDLELSGTTYTAPNLVSTDPDSLVKRSDLVAQFDDVNSYEITNTSGTVDLSYQNHYVDPTAGDVTLTLPDSQLTTSDGALVTIKRVENGGNIVKIETTGGDFINGYSNDVILSNKNEYTTIQALPIIGWQTLNKHTTAYASIALTTPTTFAATTGFTKLTTWDLDLFSTNQKFEANNSGSTLDVLHHTGAPFDAYSINATVSIEGLKDKYIEAQLYDGAGNPLSPFVAVNGLGAGKPITITLSAEVLMATVGTIEVRLLSESAQTLTISAASFLGNRIND